jgi:glycosyltransferase involved in cell wall biosynthesis
MTIDRKINVYHFLNGYKGGVYHVVKNLVRYSKSDKISNNIIYVIELESFRDWVHIPMDNVASETIFRYSRNENLNHVFKRLASAFSNTAILIAHDWFELGMSVHLGLINPLVYFVHGNYTYYYDLYKLHNSNIDLSLCVSPISLRLIADKEPSVPKVLYYRFPVKEFHFVPKSFNKLSIAVIAENLRDPNKGISRIKEINNELTKYSIPVEWHFAGSGFTKEELFEWWDSVVNVPNYYGYLEQESLDSFYASANIYLLPSHKEGVPVSLIEAMKAGCIPVVTLWAQNVEDLVVDGYTGYVIDDSRPETYAKALNSIFSDKVLSEKISRDASIISANNYNPYNQVFEFERCLHSLPKSKSKVRKYIYGSRLDMPWIPNSITIALRKLKSKCRLLYFQLS